jgi:3-hydroxymyristoyl/3-hydroxydecanoyl-(acyl carrier protein) dehydratase
MNVRDPIVRTERRGEGAAELELTVPRDLAYFEGHFPGTPVVPGVVQIRWALALARRCLGLEGEFAGVEALKFQQTLAPGAEVRLELGHTAGTSKLRFAYRTDHSAVSSGRVLLRSAS